MVRNEMDENQQESDGPEVDFVLTLRFNKKAAGTLTSFRFTILLDRSAAGPIDVDNLTLNR